MAWHVHRSPQKPNKLMTLGSTLAEPGNLEPSLDPEEDVVEETPVVKRVTKTSMTRSGGGALGALSAFLKPLMEAGDYDGTLLSASSLDGRELSQPKSLDILVKTWDKYIQYKDMEQKVKIAVLDTGIDLGHPDWKLPRIQSFRGNQPVRDCDEPPQSYRIKMARSFCKPNDAEVTDTCGHGTQVAGLVLRFAPQAELYVGQICTRESDDGSEPPDEASDYTYPRIDVLVQAIDWAIEMSVDIINISLGFQQCPEILYNALIRAKNANILVFAAMSNEGNNEPGGAAWPARSLNLCIGVHSSVKSGTRRSDFCPPAVPYNPNLMTVGEEIVTHLPRCKWSRTDKGKAAGGRGWQDRWREVSAAKPADDGDADAQEFRTTNGTSFATPIMASMAAIILAFTRQPTKTKEYQSGEYGRYIDMLKCNSEMATLLASLGKTDDGGYTYVYPQLLWHNFKESSKTPAKEHGWNTIRDAFDMGQ